MITLADKGIQNSYFKYITFAEKGRKINMIRKKTGTNKKMEILKMKNILSEMKLPLHEINSNLNTAKEKIIDLEDITMKNRGKKHLIFLCFSFLVFLV